LGWVGQASEQEPQFAGSVVVSTQAPLHSMAGGRHAKSHTPATQVGVALAGGMQTLAQVPQ